MLSTASGATSLIAARISLSLGCISFGVVAMYSSTFLAFIMALNNLSVHFSSLRVICSSGGSAVGGEELREARISRCDWASLSSNPLVIKHHDKEWGVPVRDDRTLFEFLVLEGAQAGLSWETILNKRDNYRNAVHNFQRAK